MRERELKPEQGDVVMIDFDVAPHAGARIETSGLGSLGFSGDVAPHAGARIETGTGRRRHD